MNDIINSELNNVSRDMHKNYNGIYLTDSEFSILKQNGIDINKYSNINDLMFDIEDILTEDDNEELELVLINLSEFNYYHNTNK